jgi:hypothetical protein
MGRNPKSLRPTNPKTAQHAMALLIDHLQSEVHSKSSWPYSLSKSTPNLSAKRIQAGKLFCMVNRIKVMENEKQ